MAVRRSLITAGVLTATAACAAPQAAPARPLGEINVRDFGAKADGVTDDAPSINAAIKALRDQQTRGSGDTLSPRLVFPTGTYAVRGSIDLTGLQAKNLVVDGDGSVILGGCKGAPVIDALGSRYLTIRDLTILGDKTDTPRVGLQIGRIVHGAVADDHLIENLKIIGSYQLACLLNIAAETTEFGHLLLWNNFPDPDSYCLVQDGLNHFAVASAFTAGRAAPTERDDSFNENEFINCDFRHGGGGVPVWLGNTSRHKFTRCYAAGKGPAAFVVYCSGNSHAMLDVDCHCETTGLRSVFLFTGSLSQPTIRGFSYKDHETFAAGSVFVCDPKIEKVRIENARIEIAAFSVRACTVFDDPRRWTLTGMAYIGSPGHWNGADGFSGTLLEGARYDLVGAVGARAAAGESGHRPTGLGAPDAGRLFLDQTLGKLIVWSGEAWHDANGAEVGTRTPFP
jgi:hypothetical protein